MQLELHFSPSFYLHGGAGELAVDGQQGQRYAVRRDALRTRAVGEVVGAGVTGAAQRVVVLDEEVIVADTVVPRLTRALAVVGGLWQGRKEEEKGRYQLKDMR